MENILSWLGVGVGAYMLGCIPTGYLLGRLRGVDIRRLGSGNIGATNVFRCLGKRLGILTLIGDVLKGWIPVFLARRVFAGGAADEAALLAAALAVAGHVWPVTMKFKGGKGVATAAGALMGVVPLAMGLALVVWLSFFFIGGYVSIASMAAAVTVAVATWCGLGDDSGITPVVVTLLAVMTLWRHRTNIVRLRQGTESRFRGLRRRPPATAAAVDRKTQP